MLLFHRVSSLKDKTLAAGTIAVSKGADSAWVLRSPGGFEEVIIGVRAFEEYARGRSFKPATLQHLNAITPKLFPGDWPTSEPLSNSHVSCPHWQRSTKAVDRLVTGLRYHLYVCWLLPAAGTRAGRT